jgi:predicted Zn finger-like uncharacterized protein
VFSNFQLISPPDIHQIPNYIWVWILSRRSSTSCVKAMVTGFFGVLGHVRSEYRKFRDDRETLMMMRRPRPDPTKFDLTFRCPECGYKIKPSEIRFVDGEHVKCPQCGKLTLYIPKKST